MRRKIIIVFSFLLFAVLVSYLITKINLPSIGSGEGPGASLSITTTPSVLGTRTKTTDCVAYGVLPDSGCTPGAVFPAVTKDQVCTSGYSASVRNVPDSVKKQAYTEYGITTHFTGEYEVDHLISLELGGSNDISNLWPEAAEPRPGFHEKDQVENYLHREVCSGQLSLHEAQDIIARDWQSVIIK